MPGNLSAFTSLGVFGYPIPERSEATPGLFNQIFSGLSANLDRLNSDVSNIVGSSVGTTESILGFSSNTLRAESGNTILMLPYSTGLVSKSFDSGGMVFNAKAFGAMGDGSTDDTTALNNCLKNAVAAQGIMFIPPGTYRITAPIGPAQNFMRVVGAGHAATVIRQDSNNTACIQFGGYFSVLADSRFSFKNPQSSSSTLAICVDLFAPQWGTIDRIAALGGAYGIRIDPVATNVGAGGGTTNYIASCSVRDLYVQQWSVTGIELIPIGGGIEGCVFQNLFLDNRDASLIDLTASFGIDVAAATEIVFHGVSIDNGKLQQSIQATTCDNIIFQGLHFELQKPRLDFGGFVFLNGGGSIVQNAIINGLTAVNNSILTASAITTDYALIRVNQMRLMANGIKSRANTVTTPNFSVLMISDSGNTRSELYLRGVNTDTTRRGSLPDPTILREFNSFVPDGSAATVNWPFSSESSLGFYRSAASTIALSYGTFSIPLSANLDVGGQGQITSVSNQVRVNVGGNLVGIFGGSGIQAFSGTLSTNNDGTALAPAFTVASELSLGWYRSAASTEALSYGTLDLTAGVTSIGSLKVKSGTNNSCGTAVLGSNGSVNVANTYVKTGDLIFLTDQSPGGTLGDLEVGGIRNSSGFTIQSTSVTDTSTVAWLIVRPG